jgi:phosphoribosylformylglycinamidine synthase
MAQIVGSVNGMAEACRGLDTPVVSGNVSLYNETDGVAIQPCPVIGMVGVIDNVSQAVGVGLNVAGTSLFVVGQETSHDDGWLGCSLYARSIAGRNDGAPPPVNIAEEARNGAFIREQIALQHIVACHDISDGGLVVAVAEMVMAGTKGAELQMPKTATLHGWAFGEDQGRYIVAVQNPDGFSLAATAASVPIARLGTVTDGTELKCGTETPISDVDLRTVNESFLPDLMS